MTTVKDVIRTINNNRVMTKYESININSRMSLLTIGKQKLGIKIGAIPISKSINHYT
jgi:hypothetical protein